VVYFWILLIGRYNVKSLVESSGDACMYRSRPVVNGGID